jgi:DNA-directed RNA polymerase specialized sigma54-like protein
MLDRAPSLQMNQTQSMQMRQEQKQILRMEQANLLEMPEDDFHQLISEIEHEPLFQKLYGQEKLIRYQRPSRTSISSSFYEIKEEVVADKGSLDVESLLQNKEHVVRLIQELGMETFNKYFLFPESGMTPEEIARECDLDVSEVRKINNLIDDFSVKSEFYHPSNITSDSIRYSKIASVDKDDRGFIIGYFAAPLARGRYAIDYEKFEALKAAGKLTDSEIKAARQLFKKLELINSRKDTITQILQNIIDKQALYLESGNTKSLLPLSQKELAKNIEVAPSSISRAIRGKSIETPWGKEVPLKNFFPRPKRFKMELLKQLLETEQGLSSDEAIRRKLQENFGVAISRRSVANLRKELKFPAAHRKHHAARGE